METETCIDLTTGDSNSFNLKMKTKQLEGFAKYLGLLYLLVFPAYGIGQGLVTNLSDASYGTSSADMDSYLSNIKDGQLVFR